MLERRSIANQVLSSVTYCFKWATSRGTGGPYPIESVAHLPWSRWPTSRGITAPLETESAPSPTPT
ncbi:hypothetical protein DFAR_1000001 [Desulfarculales bacterium]